jgi:SNF2 family DNA or RNA helicase
LLFWFLILANILEVLLRLRQCCNHPSLLGERQLLVEKSAKEIFDRVEKENAINYNDPAIRRLIDILRENALEDCAICLDTMTKPVVTPCGHFFCEACILGVIKVQNNSPCPMCRAELFENRLLQLPPPPAEDANEEDGDFSASQEMAAAQAEAEEERILQSVINAKGVELKSSSKIEALIDLLTTAMAKDPSTKVVLFSQWAKMLDLVEPFLKAAKIHSVRFDGSMSRQARNESIRAFQHESDVQVFCCTLKAAGVGLNLCAANMVCLSFLMHAGRLQTV